MRVDLSRRSGSCPASERLRQAKCARLGPSDLALPLFAAASIATMIVTVAGCGGGTGATFDAATHDGPGQAADARPQPTADVHLIGRFTAEAQPRFDWPGTGIRTRTSDPTLAITLTDGGQNTFEIFVDGKPTGSFVAQAGTHDYPVATGLPAGAHDVLISRRTETFFGATTYGGMKGAVIATPGPDRFIEMVGDSITCGYGVLGPDESSCFSSTTESEAHAWGMLAANQLGAAHVAIAFSGKGVIRNGDGKTVDLVPALYERTLGYDDPAPWGFTGYTPDVVVVNLGTNDFAKGDPGQAFVTGYTAFAAAIRAHHPDAWILIAQSPMITDGYPAGAMQRTKLNGYLDAVVAARKAAGDTKIDTLALDEQDGATDKYACDYHPSLVTHQKMATKLVAKIRALTGW